MNILFTDNSYVLFFMISVNVCLIYLMKGHSISVYAFSFNSEQLL